MTLQTLPSALHVESRLDSYRGFLVDLDGTILRGDEIVPGADRFLDRFGDRTVIVSNNSSDTPATMVVRLARRGMAVSPERILLAGALAIELLAAESPGARVLLVGSGVLAEYAAQKGLRPVQFAPDIVLLARDEAFDYRRLAQAANAIRGGARFCACNADLTHPGPHGFAVPETGALTAAVAAVAGCAPSRVFGKPDPALFLAGLDLLGTRPAEALVIGDNPATDGTGAALLGVDFRRIGATFDLAAEPASA